MKSMAFELLPTYLSKSNETWTIVLLALPISTITNSAFWVGLKNIILIYKNRIENIDDDDGENKKNIKLLV